MGAFVVITLRILGGFMLANLTGSVVVALGLLVGTKLHVAHLSELLTSVLPLAVVGLLIATLSTLLPAVVSIALIWIVGSDALWHYLVAGTFCGILATLFFEHRLHLLGGYITASIFGIIGGAAGGWVFRKVASRSAALNRAEI